MLKPLSLALLALSLTAGLSAQEGCTDPTACNYDDTSVTDDGSCVFDLNPCGDCNTSEAVCIGGCTNPTEANY